MIELRQATAGQDIPLGYFVDSTDGDTEETGLTIANTDIKIWKWGATTLANKNSGGATHISNGVYYAVLDAADTDTLGPLAVFVHVSGALTVRLECAVLPANVWDSKYGSDKLQVDLTQIGGGAQSATDLKDFADEGYDPATNKVQGVVLVDTVTDDVGITQAGADKVWGSATRTLTAGTKDTEIDAIKAKTDNLPADPASETNVNANQTRIDSLQSDLTDIKGLLGVNSVLDDCTYSSNKATAGNLYVYDSKANAELHDKATGLLLKLEGVAVLSGSDTVKLTRTV